ncbi:MAG: regulatory protein RecX [Terriglobia bacterium]
MPLKRRWKRPLISSKDSTSDSPCSPASEKGLYSLGLKLLARRPFSVHELTLKLSDHEPDPLGVSRTVGRLLSEGYLDDRKYIESFLHSRERKCEGFARMSHELRSRGVSGELIQETLRKFYPLEQERETLHQAFLKKARTILPPMDEKKLSRLYNHLLRKGFRDEDIRREFRAYVKNPDEQL